MQRLHNLTSRGPWFAPLAIAFASVVGLTTAQAGFVLPIDTDGADDGPVTFNPRFSFGGDTTSASSSVASVAYGMPPGDSIFGGNGLVEPDTYVFRYDPAVDADNLVIPVGADLGNGNLATGLTGGAPGIYRVYATWPFTTSVSGGPTSFNVDTLGDSFSVILDQNGLGDAWIKLGEVTWTSGEITSTQQPTGANTFVSMRSAGLLFEPVRVVPEPHSYALFAGLGLLGLVAWRRRSRG